MESPLKPEYDDAMLEGAIEDAYFTKRYGAVERVDGLSNEHYFIMQDAKELAEKNNADRAVASGIAVAILDSLIVYGEIGEKFLKQKLEQQGEEFSKTEYAKDIAKSIVAEYQYDRKQKIIDGVEDALNNSKENLEANAAKSTIMAHEYFAESMYDEGHLIEERYLEGKYIDSEKMMKRLTKMHYKPISEEQALKNLNIAYGYLSEHYDEISKPFKSEFEGKSKSKILAYYIANLHDTEMERVLKFAREERTKEESR